jgi:antitoxin YefM
MPVRHRTVATAVLRPGSYRDLDSAGARISGLHVLAAGWPHKAGLLPVRPSPVSKSAVLAILMAMSATEHLPLADVKNRLSEVVDRLEREHGRVVVTKHGRPAAVMLSVEDLESLEETLEILSNPRLLGEVRKGERDARVGRKERLSRDELVARRGQG